MKGQEQARQRGGRKPRERAVKGKGAGEQQDEDQQRKQERKQGRGREKGKESFAWSGLWLAAKQGGFFKHPSRSSRERLV